MENKQGTKHELSPSTTTYCSTLQELDPASSSRYWTSIKYESDGDDEGYVRVLPGRDVQQYNLGQIKLLEKIGEGGQGTIYTAELSYCEMVCSNAGLRENVVVAKVYRGSSGQWPEDVFGLHLLSNHICQFLGYCLEGETFYLVMQKYDCSLRNFLDKQLMGNELCEGRPLPDNSTLIVIIQIAIGMCFLHKNNILHRDLKADNVFIKTRESSENPPNCYIGDFDVASKVVGTRFWRAPEVLQALKERKVPSFTPKADVYSFAMTCYEILTGGVPLEEVGAGDYDAVVQYGVRPELPSKLNPKFKNFMRRCWHQDPELRPTFKEIVVELKELHRELIIGSEIASRSIDRIFTAASTYLDTEASPEACLLELKALLQALLVKYGEEDFLLLGLEIVADIEQFQSEFGFWSFREHPVLPFKESVARHKLHDKWWWKLKIFGRISPPIRESSKIVLLFHVIMPALRENYPSRGYTADQPEREEILKALEEERDGGVLPEPRHVVCQRGSPEQTCDLCKHSFMELLEDIDDKEEALDSCLYGIKYCLYADEDLESLASPSSLWDFFYKTMLVTLLLTMLLTSFLTTLLTNNDSHCTGK